MLCLCEHAELPELLVDILHVCGDAGLDRAEVVVVKLLTLGSLRAEEGSAGELEVLSLIVKLLVDKEILLLGSDGRGNTGNVGLSEKVENLNCLCTHALHRAEKRSLFIENLACVGTERGGNIKRAVADKRGRGGIPCCVASRLKGRADTAARERGRVGLALDELLARELHDYAVAVRLNEAVVLLGGNARHGLEPVGVVGSAHLYRPVLHRRSDYVSHADIERLAVLNGFFERSVSRFWKSLLHFFVIEYHASEHFGYLRHKKTLLTDNFCDFKKQAPRLISAAPLPSLLSVYSHLSFLSSVFAGCI